MGYSTLLQYDPQDGARIIPDLAESYQISPDGKKVSFTLRKSVRWHDGKTFTSEDVKYNFDRWMKPPEGVVITRKEIAAAVERVETPRPDAVDIYLKYPSASFVPLVAMSPASMLPPQHLRENKTMGFNILGTGPYKLKRYSRGVGVEHVKNEDYFIKGRPYLDGISQYLIPDNAARFAALRTGAVRTTFLSLVNITPSQAETARTQMADRLNVARIPALGHTVIYLNATRPPFNDVRVRQAIDMALDRNKAMQVAEGRGRIAALMPPGPWALPDDELTKRPGYRGVAADDIARAKALLAEAGHPDGLRTSALSTVQYNKETVAVQDQLKAIGVQVTIDTVDQPTAEKRRVEADFALSVFFPAQPINDPDLFLSFAVTGGGRNYGRFSDKQIDDWYDEQSKTIDAEKRKEIVLKTQRRALDLAALPVLYTNLLDLPYWKCIRNYFPEKQFGYYGNLKRQDIWLAEGCR